MKRDPAIDLLSELVACSSVNPKRQIPNGAPFGEERLVRLLEKKTSAWGANTEVQEIAPGRFNLLARFEGKNPGFTLMLESHGDTVPADGMTIPPFAPQVQGDRLYGRGSCDNKGSMTAILLGIGQVLEEDGALPISVCFVTTCDEELGANGAHALMKSGFRADAAVVGEPTDLSIIHAHKGAIRWKIQTKGVAAHSAIPERGVNAIYLMRRVLECLEEDAIPKLATQEHALLGSPTLSVGTILGGSQVNIVPSLCEIEVDRRTLPGEVGSVLTEEIVLILEALKSSVKDFDYSLEATEWYPAYAESLDSPIARIVTDACRRVLGEATFTTAPWTANSGVFKEAGIPCVLFGPGSIQQAHTKDEFIELEQVRKAIRVYAEIIRGFEGSL